MDENIEGDPENQDDGDAGGVGNIDPPDDGDDDSDAIGDEEEADDEDDGGSPS